jgi:hypothetical protein
VNNEIDSASKDLTLKYFVLPIAVVNKKLLDSKFYTARIIFPKDWDNKNSSFVCVKETAKPNMSFEDIISSVYKINCKKLEWVGENQVKINYCEN